MAYQIALPAFIANLPILSEFRFVPGSGRGLWKQSRAEIANQVAARRKQSREDFLLAFVRHLNARDKLVVSAALKCLAKREGT